MIMAGCLNTRQAARAFDMRVYLLIGSAIALGTAMQVTGAADLMATGVVSVFAPFGPVVLMSALFLLVAILTNVLSNSATAILFTPIAVGAANQIGADPTLFAMTVLLRGKHLFCHTDRLSDQPAGDGPGTLQLRRLPARRRPHGGSLLDCLHGLCQPARPVRHGLTGPTRSLTASKRRQA